MQLRCRFGKIWDRLIVLEHRPQNVQCPDGVQGAHSTICPRYLSGTVRRVHGFRLDEVTVTRGPASLLAGINVCIPAGRCTAVMGASGAGKTTMLRLLNRLTEPTTGRVLLDGVPIAELDVPALRRRVGLVSQAPVLLADRVLDEVRVGRPDLPDDRAGELLARVGLAPRFATRTTGELSGGEAQRLCLARSLAVEPEILLLDEPTSALDGPTATVIGVLVREHVSTGGTVVLVSHDHGLIGSVAERVLLLEHGHLVGTARHDSVRCGVRAVT